ncbi:hypothetical protein FHW69_001826 [Luteibacter sp. Sphag1AF]|uniref:hypothetical protein n=1 Tax=Luteibacter sp. Sphag1AF TaxID=2587031 RepID=UPI00160FBAFE|nr:hypothetical protein [Luteibacter sp. Sphag1AF]MBB3227225.1 hypothetical protein [Luteibacter sp. Sphag1AF]
MKYSLLIATAAFAVAVVSAPAIAAPAPQDQASHDAPAFSDLDKDNKGYLSRKDLPKDVDALKPLRAHFGEADTDHNGKLSPAEYNAYVHKDSAPQQH